MNIIHILPSNKSVCGGIKVHHQLAELEKALGYNSWVAYESAEFFPSWFDHDTSLEVTYKKIVEIIDNKKEWKNTVVIGWEDLNVLRNFPGNKKIAYIQGESLFNSSLSTAEINKFWVSSKWNKNHIKIPDTELIEPFIDFQRFYHDPFQKLNLLNVLVLRRKNGLEKWGEVRNCLSPAALSLLNVNFLHDSYEKVYLQELRKSGILFAHSYPEGLGLPALEAMACNVLVIGYSGGGGTDFMRDSENCFLAKDGDAGEVAKIIETIIFRYNRLKIDKILDNARRTVEHYSVNNTKSQLIKALNNVFN